MIDLTAPEQALVRAALVFAHDHVEAHAAQRASGALDNRDALRAAASLGLLGMQVPTVRGGLGLSFACKCRVAELLGATDFGFAMALVNTHNIAEHLARAASPRVADALVPALLRGERTGCTALTEPGAGSDFSAITMRATKVADGWLLDGVKAWIVNATHADVIVVYAQTETGSGARGIAAFVVDATREGFGRGAAADIGVRSIGTGSFALQGFRCADDEMLHAPGDAFKAALVSINGARTYVAAMCCGMLAESLRIASKYGTTRLTFGKPLHDHQGWRLRLAEAAVDLEAARLLVDAATLRIDAGLDAQTEAARAKVFATRAALQHIAALQHAMGAEGLRDVYPLGRHLAAAQVATLVDGSTEMLLERIARDVRTA